MLLTAPGLNVMDATETSNFLSRTVQIQYMSSAYGAGLLPGMPHGHKLLMPFTFHSQCYPLPYPYDHVLFLPSKTMASTAAVSPKKRAEANFSQKQSRVSIGLAKKTEILTKAKSGEKTSIAWDLHSDPSTIFVVVQNAVTIKAADVPATPQRITGYQALWSEVRSYWGHLTIVVRWHRSSMEILSLWWQVNLCQWVWSEPWMVQQI